MERGDETNEADADDEDYGGGDLEPRCIFSVESEHISAATSN